MLFTRISLSVAREMAGNTGEGQRVARHEQEFCAGNEAPLSLDELLVLLSSGANVDERSREDAIACYLSAGEGWRDALKILGGTFAEDATRLKERKAD